MTRILDLYFARSILQGVMVSMLLFAGLFFFILFIKELRYVGNADYDFIKAALFVALTLPQQLYELAPSIILIGSLIALGNMADNSELVVIRAAGLSDTGITRMVLQVGLVIALLIAMLGEYVIPDASALGKSMRVQALNQQVIAGGGQGLWSRDADRYINIGSVLPGEKLQQVGIYEIGQQGQLKSLTRVGMAERSDNGWLLKDVQETRFEQGKVSSQAYASSHIEHLIEPRLFDVLRTEPENMSAMSLYQYSNYLEANELDSGRFQLQFWIKLFTPLTCLVMILIALPLVLGSHARSGGSGQRIVIGLSIGILFYVFNRMVNYMGLSYGVHPLLSASLPPLIVAIFLFSMLRKA